MIPIQTEDTNRKNDEITLKETMLMLIDKVTEIEDKLDTLEAERSIAGEYMGELVSLAMDQFGLRDKDAEKIISKSDDSLETIVTAYNAVTDETMGQIQAMSKSLVFQGENKYDEFKKRWKEYAQKQGDQEMLQWFEYLDRSEDIHLKEIRLQDLDLMLLFLVFRYFNIKPPETVRDRLDYLEKRFTGKFDKTQSQFG